MSIGEIAMLVNDDFSRPLNKQIQDMLGLIADDTYVYSINSLGNIIKDGEGIKVPGIPSLYEPDKEIFRETLYSPNDLKINCNGTVYICVSCTLNLSNNHYMDQQLISTLHILKNGEVINTRDFRITLEQDEVKTDSIVLDYILQPISKNDIFSCYLTVRGLHPNKQKP